MSGNPNPSFGIALVDDDEAILAGVDGVLNAAGFDNVFAMTEAETLFPAIERGEIGLVLLDIAMPGQSGMELLPEIVEAHPEVGVVMLTACGSVDRAVECMRLGALDYLTKPVEAARLVATVRRLVELRELEHENLILRERFLAPPRQRMSAFSPIVTVGIALDPVMRYAETIAASPHPVLITGETGTGKDLFARALHDLSGRAGDFVAVNLAGLDDTFFTDLLFGHRAGAYTGAAGNLDGLIEKAKDGTLFLDEIGDISLQSQVKLLRVIEQGEYYPLGSDLLKRSKARIVVATNRDLDTAIASGSFRRDLFYRLQRHRLHIPPLRERFEDLPLLLEHFVAKASAEIGKGAIAVPSDLSVLLRSHDFPGNVRELETMVFEAVSLHREGQLPLEPFRAAIARNARPSSRPANPSALFRLLECLPSLAEVGDFLVDEALRRAEGNQSAAARLLGVSQQAVSKRLRRARLPSDDEGV